MNLGSKNTQNKKSHCGARSQEVAACTMLTTFKKAFSYLAFEWIDLEFGPFSVSLSSFRCLHMNIVWRLHPTLRSCREAWVIQMIRPNSFRLVALLCMSRLAKIALICPPQRWVSRGWRSVGSSRASESSTPTNGTVALLHCQTEDCCCESPQTVSTKLAAYCQPHALVGRMPWTSTSEPSFIPIILSLTNSYSIF